MLLDNDAAARWRTADALEVFQLSRSAWSLAAIAGGLAKSLGRKPVCAVPDYMCNASLWPLRRNRAELVFYPIEPEGLQPDWKACDALPAIDAFMLVHYFGKPADAARAQEWAWSRRAVLIEDAAHVLSPMRGIGQHGDFVLYSPRKLLPIPDGAFLVVRTPAANLLPLITTATHELGRKRAPAFKWRMQRSRLSRFLPSPSTAALSFTSDEAMPVPEHAPMMSRVAAALIAKADLAAVAEKRRRNATAVLAAITGWPGWASLFSPADDWVPYHLPMRCSSPEIAERYFDHLHRAGLAAERWPDLPPEISACSAARRLQQTILHLPCHQFLDTADLAVPWPALADSGPLA